MTNDNTSSEILERLGMLVAKWNSCERLLQELLISAIGGERNKVTIATAHMGTTAMCDAIRTIAAHTADPHVRLHAPHLLTYFEILREYRNYYVHGLTFPLSNGAAVLQTTSARGKFNISCDRITVVDFDFVLDHVDKWIRYINSFLVPLLWPNGAPAQISVEQLSLLERPRLPKKLAKNLLSSMGKRT